LLQDFCKYGCDEASSGAACRWRSSREEGKRVKVEPVEVIKQAAYPIEVSTATVDLFNLQFSTSMASCCFILLN
jgi:hypothetical protein